jgi:membrane-bound serine protease (ClpP class)
MLVNTSTPALKPSLKFIVPSAIGISLVFFFLVYIAVQALRRRVFTGNEGLIGEIGTAQTDIAAEGKVFVHGELWRAEADEIISQGSKVRVVQVLRNLTIKVTKV